MFFQPDPNKEYTNALRQIKSKLSPVFYPTLLNCSFEVFIEMICRSSGLKTASHKEIFDSLNGYKFDEAFRVMLQANSIASDIEIQDLYPVIVGSEYSQLLCYQVENIYFAKCSASWDKLTTPQKYLEAQLGTTWNDPLEKLTHCYENWTNSDDAKLDIITVNAIKNTILGCMTVDARRIQKKVCGRASVAAFSSWMFLKVLEEKERWFPLRPQLIDCYYADYIKLERNAAA